MIENEKQYDIARSCAWRFKSAIAAFNIEAATKRTSAVLAKAQLEALKSEYEVLMGQIKEYESGV